MRLPPQTLTARWLFPVTGPPLPGGVLTIAGGRIFAIEPHGRRADLDLGDCAILPGLVNAHTHLDLTGMRGLAPPSPDFTAWLLQVIRHRRQRSPQQVQEDIHRGLVQCIRTGTTLLGDVSGDGGSWDALAASPIRAVVFRELLGLPEDRAAAAWQSFLRWRENLSSTPNCRPGVSPHAPYSARLSLYRAAASAGVPLSTHLAETRAELQLMAEQQGPFVDFLSGLGVWSPDGLASGPREILDLCKGKAAAAFAHGNYLTENESIPENAAVVYCPRTHAAFVHSTHPFRELLRRGVRVALGTDSLASNPDLDLLAEARFLHANHPDVSGDVILRMATLAGAEALGWADETGSLEAGKSADLVVVPLAGAPGDDPYSRLLDSDLPAMLVMCRGRWLSTSDEPRLEP
jgi:cytosine/adenosine deaminase-related metal-dependent hydrolase